MANNNQIDEFYKVSFITTSSINIPKLLKQTGGLIIMNNTDDFICKVNPTHGIHHPKSLWFRGDLVATGYGALCEEERDNLTYLAGSYNSLFNSIDDRMNDTAYWLNAYNSYFLDAYSYMNLQDDRIKNESYRYTDKVIDDLIGCAPDTLDTLGEIAHWLELDKSLGLDTINHVKNITNTYIYREPTETPGAYWTCPDSLEQTSYTYIANYGLKSENILTEFKPTHNKDNEYYVIINGQMVQDTDKNGTYLWQVDNNGSYLLDTNGDKIPVWKKCTYDPGEIPTSYETFTVSTDGLVAMRDYQISTHFANNPQLSTILECMLDPYEYKKPTIECISYTNEYVEVGTTYNWSINYHYDVNDAGAITQISINPSTNVSTPFGVNYPNLTSGEHTITGKKLISFGTNIISNYNTIKYTDAVQQFYPQLLRRNIEHYCEEGLFDGGSINIENKIALVGLYKLYWGTGYIDIDNVYKIPDDEYTMKDLGKGIFIDSINNQLPIEIDSMFINDEYNIMWFGIPQLYPNREIYIIANDISQPMNIKNPSNILQTYPNTSFRFNDGTYYDIIYIQHNKFTMANDYKVVVELK